MTRIGEMVNFPSGSCWEDSGEGGLFVMLVVPKPEDWSHWCAVDVEILMTYPDAQVSGHSDLWEEDLNSRKSDFRKWTDASEVLASTGRKDLTDWALRAISQSDLSVAVLAAVHMGDTGTSLWNPKEKRYWTATVDDLTADGREIYNTMQRSFGVAPLLLTFLDT